MPLVPARYIGSYPVTLANGAYTNADGKPLANNILNPGDTICLPDHEILGYTHKYDARRSGTPRNIGIGRVVLPEDAGASEDALFERGYEFIIGRPDFAAIVPAESKKRDDRAKE